MNTTLWLVRHGESTWNAQRRMQGWADPPLTERGRWQARQAAQRLADLPLTAIYSSTQQRATATAHEIAGVTGLEVQTDERLREQGFGEATGMVWNWEDVADRWPEAVEAAERGESIRPYIPGTEAMDVLTGRVEAAFAEIRTRHPDEAVVVVAHGGVLRAYLAPLLHSDNYLANLHLGNGSLSLVIFDERDWATVKFLNDTCHLREAPPPD